MNESVSCVGCLGKLLGGCNCTHCLCTTYSTLEIPLLFFHHQPCLWPLPPQVSNNATGSTTNSIIQEYIFKGRACRHLLAEVSGTGRVICLHVGCEAEGSAGHLVSFTSRCTRSGAKLKVPWHQILHRHHINQFLNSIELHRS